MIILLENVLVSPIPNLITFIIRVNFEIGWFLKNFFPPKCRKFENVSSHYPKLEKLKSKICLNHLFDMQIMSLEWKAYDIVNGATQWWEST
jgi:hypothetical protein